MQRKTKFLAAGAAALLAAGGLIGLAQAGSGEGWGHWGGHGGGMHRMWGDGEGRGHGMKGQMGHNMMARYDADEDGKVTQQEIDQNRTQWHAEFDADKNASLSVDEFRNLWLKARNEMMVREFQHFDSDGNGQVTLGEYSAPMARMVAERDRNGDGALSPEDRGRHGGRGEGYHRGGQGQGMGQGMGGGDAEPPGQPPEGQASP
jgi:Ca2+-binding EF-hand superfamily protein